MYSPVELPFSGFKPVARLIHTVVREIAFFPFRILQPLPDGLFPGTESLPAGTSAMGGPGPGGTHPTPNEPQPLRHGKGFNFFFCYGHVKWSSGAGSALAGTVEFTNVTGGVLNSPPHYGN